MKLDGAGVLPVAVYNGEPHFLMSKEKYTMGWKDSNKYADFGGRRDSGESIRRCAARECYEESMGFMGSEDEIFKKLSKNHPDYICKVEHKNASITYFIKMEYIKGIEKMFKNVIKYCEKWTNYPKGHFEKSELWYLPYSVLKRDINKTAFQKKFRPYCIDYFRTILKIPIEKLM